MSSVLIYLPDDLYLKIMLNRVIKWRILVDNSSSSQVMQNFHVTDHKDKNVSQTNKIS